VKFLAIHPFQDGNGRLSRVLTNLMLLRAGYTYASYTSLESVIEHNKEAYYLALRRTQTTLGTESADWEPWTLFFLHSMRSQIERLRENLAVHTLSQADLPPGLVSRMEAPDGYARVQVYPSGDLSNHAEMVRDFAPPIPSVFRSLPRTYTLCGL